VDEANAGENDFEGVLRFLRSLGTPCEPPVGVGTFDVLYASSKEVVVWYSPAREEHSPGEVSIPCSRLVTAWAALTAGEPLDEQTLARIGAGVAGGRWLLAVLAQVPGVHLCDEPVALTWQPAEMSTPSEHGVPLEITPPVAAAPTSARSRRRSTRAPRAE